MRAIRGVVDICVCVCVYGFKTFLIFENVSVNCNRLNSVFV